MIAFFPSIYPDELVYSWIARYYCQSGCVLPNRVHFEIFINPSARPSIEFCNIYTEDMLSVMNHLVSKGILIERHTMFPSFYFHNANCKRNIYQSLLHNKTPHFLKLKGLSSLAYCPICAAEDRKRYGEAYWHRTHQIKGLTICPQHGCYLVKISSEMMKQALHQFVSAEQIVPPMCDAQICKCHRVIKLAQYMKTAFDAPMNFSTYVEVGDFLFYAINGGEQDISYDKRNSVLLLWSHFNTYYQDIVDNPLCTLGKFWAVFSGKIVDFQSVCMVSMFLGIPADDLVRLFIPLCDVPRNTSKKIIGLHQRGVPQDEIARRLHITHRQVAVELARSQSPGDIDMHKALKYIKLVRCDEDIPTVDNFFLPQVKDAIRQLQGDGTVCPQRVTAESVRKLLHVSSTRLQTLPLCRAEILKHSCSVQEYCAIKVVWAANTLLKQGLPLQWDYIHVLTNIQATSFKSCLPYVPKYASEEVNQKLLAIKIAE